MIWANVGYHDHKVVEAQRSAGSRVDSVDVVQKRNVQHNQGEDNIRSIEYVVEYERKLSTMSKVYLMRTIVQFTNV